MTHIARRLLSCAFLSLAACSTPWHTSDPVEPSTYDVHSYRSPSSVGKLSRLAVMRAEIHREPDPSETPTTSQERQQRLSTSLQNATSEYLRDQKGYDAASVDEAAPEPNPASIHAMGTRLGVDGIVVQERWITRPWSTAKAVMNVFLLNLPLFQALSAVNLRVSIYETASGRLVWRREMKGEDSSEEVDVARALDELENAVPKQLRK